MNMIRSPALVARVAGLLYLAVVLASVFALTTASALITPDAATTATNIGGAELVFRLGVVANIGSALAYVCVISLLCALFWPASPILSLTAAFIGLAGCASSAAFMVNQLSALSLLSVGDGAVFSAEQSQVMARQFLRASGLGNSISLTFFGVYCLLLGLLVLRSAFLPRLLAIPLISAGAGWLIGNVAVFLAFDAQWTRLLLPVSGLGELIFTLWLLFMGVDAAKWRRQSDGASPAS